MTHRRGTAPNWARACAVGYLALTGAEVAAQLTENALLIKVLPFLLMPLLAACLLLGTRELAGTARDPLLRLVLLALGFSWLGDWVSGDVLVKIGFFLLGQLAYCLAFWRFRHVGLLARRGPAVVYGAVLLTVICAVGLQAGPLFVPVLVYGLSLASMVALASGVSRRTAVGAALFLLSDILLGYRYFVHTGSPFVVDAVVMSIYLPAQLLIVLGVAERLRRSRSRPAPAASATGRY